MPKKQPRPAPDLPEPSDWPVIPPPGERPPAPPQAPQAPDTNPDRPQRPAARGTIPLADPVTQERLAVWVEGLYSSYPMLVRREAEWVRNHPEDQEAKGRLAWYKHALSTARAIAYQIRTHKLQDLPDAHPH